MIYIYIVYDLVKVIVVVDSRYKCEVWLEIPKIPDFWKIFALFCPDPFPVVRGRIRLGIKHESCREWYFIGSYKISAQSEQRSL